MPYVHLVAWRTLNLLLDILSALSGMCAYSYNAKTKRYGFGCNCDGTGYIGQRCETLNSCPTTAPNSVVLAYPPVRGTVVCATPTTDLYQYVR